jgi:hypothetical protein
MEQRISVKYHDKLFHLRLSQLTIPNLALAFSVSPPFFLRDPDGQVEFPHNDVFDPNGFDLNTKYEICSAQAPKRSTFTTTYCSTPNNSNGIFFEIRSVVPTTIFRLQFMVYDSTKQDQPFNISLWKSAGTFNSKVITNL